MGFIPAEGLLLGVDADPEAQVMMVEQFIAEVGFGDVVTSGWWWLVWNHGILWRLVIIYG